MENTGMATVAFVEKIEDLVKKAEEKFEKHEYEGNLYVNKELHKVKPELCRSVGLSSLAALVDFTKTTVKTNVEQFAFPLIIRATYGDIELNSSLDKNLDRNYIADAKPMLPDINFNRWMSMEEFIIQLQTCFVDTVNKNALISVVSQITENTTAVMTDDGMGQKITVSKGSGLKNEVGFNPIVRLKAYRTYQEIEQVESMYLVRVKDGGELRIIEADGGAWKVEAQNRVSKYLREALSEEINAGTVVVVG